MPCPWALVIATVCGILILQVSADDLQSVKDIKAAMYKEMKYTGGCYKLLNVTGPIGCQAPTEGVASVGILINVTDVQWPLTVDRMLVVNITGFEELMLRLRSDPTSASHVRGVLVDPSDPQPTSLSSAPTFPGAFNAPYSNTSYVWNPSGTSLARTFFNFPVMMMSAALANEVATRTQYNWDNDYTGATYMAEVYLTMVARHNSTYCLKSGGCKPLGAFSVWTAMPPLTPLNSSLNNSQITAGLGAIMAPQTMLATLVTAQVDSNSFFHDYTQGADSPLSGLVTMLAAMELLRVTNASSTYTRQLLFVAMTGEPWDYMGSRRMLWEMDKNSTTTSGLDLSRIDQVIELGQVGRGYSASTNSTTLYLHSQPSGSQWGDAAALISSLKQAAAGTQEANITLQTASASNPGIPPSSLMSFLRTKPSIQGVVITEFDSQFKNPFYQSERDVGQYVDVQPMSAAALALARALHSLASPGGVPSVPLQVNMAALNSFVYSLALCLMVDGDPPASLRCPLVQSYIQVGFSNRNADGVLRPFPWRYIGVSQDQTLDPSNTNFKSDIYRFLFNIMANITATGDMGLLCDPIKNLCQPGMVCIGWKSGTDPATSAATMGRCRVSTTKFVPSLSTRVIYVDTSKKFLLDEDTQFNAKYGWPDDPLWTESDWPGGVPYVRVYMEEPYSVQVAVLVSGLLLMLLTGVLSWAVMWTFEKHIKHD
eukprot:CAMPEP_0202894688 /NCGR_PEP_ID=MMETSP1392-20130828/4034_1 /ASSEMBLY_ACC=CAM_ASM_000868 /TAXON_ID=225041 /ORGANISM="Chlamydomonas chlamydogama, Strain SAG 11-48b" /LENGTH=710 /DNA_ID=CAMNT_0049579449 /DNA_START=101 /DNA_END=2233 /DNA_ORIENTATION=+